MKLYVFRCLAASVCAMLLLSCAQRSSTTTVVKDDKAGGGVTTTTTINDKIIAELRTEWESEMLTATGSAPVINKYGDPTRDKELARRGAILDAQRNLASQISRIRLTETVSMSDLMVSTLVTSRIDAVIQDVRVISETFNEKENRWDVTVEMPKIKVLKVVEEINR